LNKTQKQYLEFFESYCEGVLSGKSKSLFEISLLNLAYVFCGLKGKIPKTKSEAKENLLKKYKIKNFSELNKRGIEIGKEVFS